MEVEILLHGNDIRIHRIDCPNANDIRERYPYRVLPARWAKKS